MPLQNGGQFLKNKIWILFIKVRWIYHFVDYYDICIIIYLEIVCQSLRKLKNKLSMLMMNNLMDLMSFNKTIVSKVEISYMSFVLRYIRFRYKKIDYRCSIKLCYQTYNQKISNWINSWLMWKNKTLSLCSIFASYRMIMMSLKN